MSRILWSVVLGALFLPVDFASSANIDVAIQFEVTDEEGRPVEEAIVEATFVYWQDNPWRRASRLVRGETGASGRVMMRSVSLGRLSYRVARTGYYDSEGRSSFRGGRIRIPVTLRSVRNPVPMSVSRNVLLVPPAVGENFAIDLVKLDFLPPHGAGETADIRIQAQYLERDEERFMALMGIHFVGENNGFYPIRLPRPLLDSSFRSDYIAPSADFRSDLVLADGSGIPPPKDAATDQDFYFRLRSRPGAEGAIEGLYGKIYGLGVTMSSKGPSLYFEAYFLNPQWNAREMEHEQVRDREGGF